MLALVKLNYMRENPPKLSGTRLETGSKNPADTGAIRREGLSAMLAERNPQRLYVQPLHIV